MLPQIVRDGIGWLVPPAFAGWVWYNAICAWLQVKPINPEWIKYRICSLWFPHDTDFDTFRCKDCGCSYSEWNKQPQWSMEDYLKRLLARAAYFSLSEDQKAAVKDWFRDRFPRNAPLP